MKRANNCTENDNTKFQRPYIDINKYFNKKYKFKQSGSWEVPHSAFKSEKWFIPTLQDKKKQLNEVKGRLNSFPLDEWSKHTKHRDPSSFIIKYLRHFNPELLTQAWCKFYECLSQYEIVPQAALKENCLVSLHLCEAPGAFISALNHYLGINYPLLKWDWYGNTLNPDYEGNPLNEMIPDDRLIRHTANRWLFGQDFTGDIRDFDNHLSVINALNSHDKVWLVTADGSVDCMSDPGEQESHVEHLHYCETMTALSVLTEEGTFVIKMFTFFEDSAVSLLYLLNCVFKEVHIFKPCSSKSGNSEVYVVCLQFKGVNVLGRLRESLLAPYKIQNCKSGKSMFDLDEISPAFLEQVYVCADLFMKHQIQTIEENIENFGSSGAAEDSFVTYRKKLVAARYVKKYKILAISDDRRLVTNPRLLNHSSFYFRQWNSPSGWSFFDDFRMISTASLIGFSSLSDIIDIKLGKPLMKVVHSNFCSKSNSNLNLADFRGFESDKLDVMNNVQIYNDVAKNVIDVSNYAHEISQNDFHVTLFHDLKLKLNGDGITFLKIPLHTNFLVGILYLLMFAFDTAVFHKTGFIVLYNSTGRFGDVEKCFQAIDNVLTDLKDDCKKRTINQIVPLSAMSNTFINLVWCYNNVICAH